MEAYIHKYSCFGYQRPLFAVRIAVAVAMAVRIAITVSLAITITVRIAVMTVAIAVFLAVAVAVGKDYNTLQHAETNTREDIYVDEE